METVNLLHYLTDDASGKADVDGLVRKLTERLEGALEGSTDLLNSRVDLDVLATVLRLVNDRRREPPGRELVTGRTIDDLNSKAVVPTIKRLNDDRNNDGRLDVLMEPSYRIYCELIDDGRRNSTDWLLTDCAAGLMRRSEGVQCRAAVQTLYCLLELSSMYPSVRELLKSSTDRLLQCLPRLLRTEYLAKFSVVAKKLLSLHDEDDDNSGRLRMIWGVLVDEKTDHNEALLLLCALADSFLGSDNTSSEVYAGEELWRLVQTGLGDSDALSRKRALYVLKRAVDNLATLREGVVTANADDNAPEGVPLFHWSSGNHALLSTLWENYILIVEMMEETQIHIIKPLLPRWRAIVDAASVTVGGTRPLLHTSWLLVLLKRTRVHNSGLIVKWGIEQFLDLDATKVPLIRQGSGRFITENLPEMLNQSAHYQRDLATPLTDCPPIGEKLVTFLGRYWSALGDDEKRRDWFRALLRSADEVSWSGVPLLFVARAFSLLPRTPVLDSSSLDVLRNLCGQHVRTVYVNQRGAVQVFVTKTMLNLIDPRQTSLVDVHRLLALIRADASYKRGSRVWTQLCDWIASRPWADTADQLESMVKALLGKGDESVYSTLPADCISLGFAKLFYLHLDSGIVDQVRAESLVYPLFDTAASANERLYLNRECADNALGAIVRLLELRCDVTMKPAFERLLDQCRSSLLDYTITRLLACISLDESALYLSAIYHLIGSGEESVTMKYVTETVGKLGSHVTSVESHDSAEVVRGLMAVRGLGQCVDVLENVNDLVTSHAAGGDSALAVLPNLTDLVMNLKRPDSDSDASGVGCRDWNGLVSSAIGAQWRVVAYSLGRRSADAKAPFESLCDRCLSALDIGTNDILEPVFRTMARIFSRVDIDVELLVRCIDVSWRRLVECARSPQAFWPAYRAFVEMSFQKRLMERGDLKNRLVLLADEIQTAAENRNGIMYELARHWTTLYSHVDLAPYVYHLVKMAMFGPVHKKGDKIVLDMNVYIATIEDLEPGKAEVNREDSRVRILIATFLLKLAGSPGNERLLQAFATGAIATWREITRTRRRHTFVNSLRHRETHRLVTSLLLIHPVLIVDRLDELSEFLCEVLEQEGQPSVRFLAEWFLILILAERRDKWSLIWENLSSRDDRKPAGQCSWLVILTHVAKLIPARTDYLLKAVPTVLPLCMAHQFNPRIFGQACLLALWRLCREDGLEKYSQISVVLDGIKNFLSVSSNSTKCTMTLLNHFSMVYDPRQDFSIQTLYVTVPRLFGLSQDEWLETSQFEDTDPAFWRSGENGTALVNARRRLENLPPGAWKLRTDDSEAIDVMIGDVQRKITPWRRMLPEGETLDAEPSRASSPNGAGLILVASLIDKTANLGGLCRSCEIFGASQFVLGSLAYVNDTQFVGLSVSAQKWVHITEVQPNFLPDYLLMQQRHGYTLVGVEQTNNSRCLTAYEFPEKTLLLLGNEKEGIPVDLIQLLDVCVEIPQQGVIRSLNVHVCGALLMWEYRRQHLNRVTN